MSITTHHGDCRAVLRTLPDQSVHAWITSPPYYGLRSYGAGPGEIGNEPTPDDYIAALVDVFHEARRVLRDNGVCLVNLGDSYAQDSKWGGASGNKNYTSTAGGLPRERRVTGYKDKDLMLIPFRVALALQADGWYVRSVMPWIKRNVMPESVTDRPTTAHEYIFLLAKSARYFWDGDAIRQGYNQNSIGRYQYSMMATAPTARQPGGDIERRERERDTRDPNPAGRNYRTSDPWLSSLDLAIEATRADLAYLEHLKKHGGLLSDEDNDPLALLVNTASYAGSHYATFPTRLVEPLLLASVPRECCSVCGAPWVRQVSPATGGSVGKGSWFDKEHTEERGKVGSNTRVHSGSDAKTYRRGETLGFAPSCPHADAPTAPGVVGDMFAGSGTVGRVAIEHGRDAVLIELNPDYIDTHIAERTDKVQVRLPL